MFLINKRELQWFAGAGSHDLGEDCTSLPNFLFNNITLVTCIGHDGKIYTAHFVRGEMSN